MHIRPVILSALLFLFAVPAYAQDWSAVTALKQGTKIYLDTKRGVELKGKIIVVTQSAIEIRSNGRSVLANKDDVATIVLARRGSRLGRALRGAAIGAGIGAGIGAIVVAATKSDGLIAAAGVIYGFPIGAVAGAATAGDKRGRLIYSAR